LSPWGTPCRPDRPLNDRLFADAALRPLVFRWYGAPEPNVLDEWAAGLKTAVPGELRDLWARTGGGLIFESEEILKPVAGPADEESLEARNEWFRSLGLDDDLLLFEEGLSFSALRRADGAIVTLGREILLPEEEFPTLSDWYQRTLRRSFGWRYDLPFAVVGPNDRRLVRGKGRGPAS
jgi:hypothetical protein